MDTFAVFLAPLLELGLPALLLFGLWRIWPREEKGEAGTAAAKEIDDSEQLKP